MDVMVRPMEEADFEACVSLLAGRPAYPDHVVAELPRLWRALLHDDAMIATVIDRPLSNARKEFAGFGVLVFATDEWIAARKRDREPYLAARTIERELSGETPILRWPGIAARNAGDGLNVLILHYAEARNLPADVGPAVRWRMMGSLREVLRGYRIKEVVQELWDEIPPEYIFNGYGRVVTDYRSYFADRGEPFPPLNRRPHLLSLTWEDVVSNPGDPLAPLFIYRSPVCSFSRAEQRMLKHALSGRTDAELARDLGVAVPTIKSHWRAVYERVARTIPEVLPDDYSTNNRHGRGMEKRRRLLEYLRSHPEELRPTSPQRGG